LDALQAALATAAGGRGRTILVEGSAGAGKSALVGAASEHSRSTGMRVLSARGSEIEREFAFGVVRQLFEEELASASAARRGQLLSGPAAPAAGAVLPIAEAPPGQTQAGFPMLHAIHWLTSNLAGERPLLLAVDDLHWADASSVRALSYVAGRIAESPVAVLAALRPDEPGAPEPLLDAVRGEPGAVRLALGPLDPDAVAELVRARFPDADAEVCEACLTATAGNPLYLQELLRAVSTDVGPGTPEPEAIHQASVPPLGDRIGRRIAPVAPEAPALASAMAVIGDGGDLGLAATLAGVSPVEAGAIAGRLRRIEVLAVEDPFAFVHPLVRRSVYDAMSQADRESAHAAAADLLETAAAPAEAVAAHRAAVTPHGSEVVATTLCRAAEQALTRGAPDEAVRWLRRARAEAAAAPEPATILALLGSAELVLWDGEAITHLREALELSDDLDLRAQISGSLADFLFLTGRWGEATEVIERALGELGDTRAAAAGSLTAIGLMIEGYAISTQSTLGQDTAALERLTQGPSWEAHALAAVRAAMTAHQGGTRSQVTALVDIALRDDELLQAHGHQTWAVSHALIALAEIDDHPRGMALGDAVIATARRSGMVNLDVVGVSHRGWLIARRGDLAEAEAVVRPALALSQETGAATAVATLFFYLQDPLLERPSLADVAEIAERMDVEAPGLGETWMEAMFLTARGRLRLADGHRARGLGDLRRVLDIATALGIGPAVSPARSLVALALPSSERGEARSLVAEELELAAVCGLDRPLGLALRAAGMLEESDEATRLISESLPPLRRVGARLEEARSLVELGATLRRSGRRGDARPHLVAGMELAEECGADRLVGRALEELQAAGARPRRSVTRGPAALTASELRVARLAASAVTNREIAQKLFVSPKTIETHLSHAYAKLGLTGQGARHRLSEALREG